MSPALGELKYVVGSFDGTPLRPILNAGEPYEASTQHLARRAKGSQFQAVLVRRPRGRAGPLALFRWASVRPGRRPITRAPHHRRQRILSPTAAAGYHLRDHP